jgi:hypothetical protein
LASFRFRFADLHWSKCRLPPRVRKTLPVDVTLKRLATDLRVLLRAMGFGMRKGPKASESTSPGNEKFSRANPALSGGDRMFALRQKVKNDFIETTPDEKSHRDSFVSR